jgi:mannose-6-phosphate isomerase
MDHLQFSGEFTKEEVFDEVCSFLAHRGFKIADFDQERPWGGYFVIDEKQADDFIGDFFPHLSPDDFRGFEKLSPKILLVSPKKRLSWQYHHRRAEIWRVIGGSVSVAVSHTDDETRPETYASGSIVELEKGQRHRLIGTDQWGVVAEIWKHTDPQHPSDEEDIVRVQDDYGR